MAAALRNDCPNHADVSRRLEALEDRMTTIERDRVTDRRETNEQLGSIHEKMNTIGMQVATISGSLSGKQANLGNVIALLSLLVAAGALLSRVVG